MFSYAIFKKNFKAKNIKKFLRWIFANFGLTRTIELAERLKNFGIHVATKYNTSVGIEDVRFSGEKTWTLRLIKRKIKEHETYKKLRAITLFELDANTFDLFIRAEETIKNSFLDIFRIENFLNPLYLISFSGARGNLTQVRQLISIRGFIVNEISKLLPYPVRRNFKESISLTLEN